LKLGRDSGNDPDWFFAVMSLIAKSPDAATVYMPQRAGLVAASIFFMLAGSASINAAAPGFLEGHLKILSPKAVDLGDENAATVTAENYGDYPLIVLSTESKRSRE
jgi:hypothetical protein